jgi:hypothetical protein
MTRLSVVGLMVLALGLTVGGRAGAETHRNDRPDAGPPLLDPNAPRQTAGGDERPGTPPPRAMDSTRTPMPDRDALPKDLQDARLAPPTPPVPQGTGAPKTGGGPNRVKEIFKSPGGGQDQVPSP